MCWGLQVSEPHVGGAWRRFGGVCVQFMEGDTRGGGRSDAPPPRPCEALRLWAPGEREAAASHRVAASLVRTFNFTL